MRFSIEVYEKMIELVKGNPCIYDTSVPQYRDVKHQKSVWEKITQEMDEPSMTWEDWRKVWRQKRDAFTRKRREMESLSSWSSVQEVTKFPLFQQMTFLIGKTPGTRANSKYTNPVLRAWEECEGREEDESIRSCTYTYTYDDDNNDDDDDDDDDNVEDNNNDDDYDDVTRVEMEEKEEPNINFEETASPRSNFSDAPSTSTGAAARKRRKRTSKSVPERARSAKVYKGSRGESHGSQLEELIAQLDDRVNRSMDMIEQFAKDALGEGKRRENNVFSFLSAKMSEFSQSTQDWMEDQMLKLYLEAKRRESEIEREEGVEQQLENQPQSNANEVTHQDDSP